MFKEISFPEANIQSAYIPESLTLAVPQESELDQDDLHFLVYIPWEENYLQHVPQKYQLLFTAVLPLLHARTTDVHTATCMHYLEAFITEYEARHAQTIDPEVVAASLILHDSGWSRLSELEIAQSLGVTGLALTETALGPKEKHAVESEAIAREVLNTYPEAQAFSFSHAQIELICKAIRYHDKPEMVAGQTELMPGEVQLLVDLDHIWSFTQANFWQDTVRKGVSPAEYAANLEQDLDSYFVTTIGKEKARALLAERQAEVAQLESITK